MIFFSQNQCCKNKKSCFEGWYFKHETDKKMFAFIVGYTTSKNDSHSFIQYTDGAFAHYFKFSINDFCFSKENMTIKIKQNVFSLAGIKVDLYDGDINISCEVKFSLLVRLEKSLYSPSIMGPFTYLPMPCRHEVVSLSHLVSGVLSVNGLTTQAKGLGYIEKDCGKSFPENYFWVHAHSQEISLMISVAYPLPLKIRGHLCIFLYNGKQYNFSLYNGTKIKRLSLSGEKYLFEILKGKMKLCVILEKNKTASVLTAPSQGGNMNKPIKESLGSNAVINFFDGKNEHVLQGKAAYEIVGELSKLEIC